METCSFPAGDDAHRKDVPEVVEPWVADAGDRVSYAIACAARRQAEARAERKNLSLGDWKVLSRVTRATAGYSKLVDRVEMKQMTPHGMDVRTTRRSLRKLSDLGIMLYKPGNGRGNFSVVGLPPAEKSGHVDVPLSTVKGGHADARLAAAKGGHLWPGKGDMLACAREARVREEDREEGVDDARVDLPDVETVLAPLTGGGFVPMSLDQRSLIEEGIRANLNAVEVCVQQARSGKKPMGLLWVLLEASKRNDWRAPAPTRSGGGLNVREILGMEFTLEENTCDTCGLQFRSPRLLAEHRYNMHDGSVPAHMIEAEARAEGPIADAEWEAIRDVA